MFRILVLLAAVLLARPALAHSKVFKCTTDGKIEYRDTPCPSGEEQTLNVPAPSPGPAVRNAPAERAALLELEKLRVAQELRAERQRTTAEREARAEAREQRAVESQRKRCDRLRLHQKWAEQDRARLSGGAAEKASIKARRDAEELAVECPA